MQPLAGRYRLHDRVGDGGTAVVYRGFDLNLKRPVAVKVLSSQQAADHRSADAVLNEARSAGRINHPHVARVYDYGETTQDGRVLLPFLVTEYVNGETLAANLQRHGALSWRDAAGTCAQVAEALAVTHDRDLVHRDITPSNVMVATEGAKIVDFGLALDVGERATDAYGRISGTPTSLAPEQLRCERARPPVDVFALGLLLYECLTGNRPWPGSSADRSSPCAACVPHLRGCAYRRCHTRSTISMPRVWTRDRGDARRPTQSPRLSEINRHRLRATADGGQAGGFGTAPTSPGDVMKATRAVPGGP